MNVCIIGEGLTSLALAKNLINKKINVHIYYKTKIQKKITSRTIGISKNNLEFFKKEIFEMTKINYWKIKKIEIYSQKIKNWIIHAFFISLFLVFGVFVLGIANIVDGEFRFES